MFTPRKTVGQMVEEAKTRIENLSLEQLQAELQSGEVQLLDITLCLFCHGIMCLSTQQEPSPSGDS